MTLNDALYIAFAGDMNAEPASEPVVFVPRPRTLLTELQMTVGEAFAHAFTH